MKNILVLSSSPRKNGNSDILCEQFIKGAKESGHNTEKIYISDMKINYCTGCGAVSYTHLTLPTSPPLCRSRWSPYH